MEYTFEKSPCNIPSLTKEINDSSIATDLTSLTLYGSALSVNFESALSESDETLLDAVVTAHTGDPLPDYIVNQIELNESQHTQLLRDNAARDFSSKLTAVLKVFNQGQGMNLAQSLWAHHRIRALEIVVTQDLANAVSVFSPLVGQTIVIDAMNLVISGDIETAYFVFTAATPDDGTQAYHALTSEFLGFMRNQIGIYLGWE